VGAVNAVQDSLTTLEDQPALVNVTANDTTLQGALALEAVSDPAHGQAELAGWQVRYTPDSQYNGPDSFTYTVTNGSDSAQGTVSVTVTAVNDAPSFAIGAAYRATPGSGAQTLPGWAADIQPGPANESGQAVHFSVTGNTNPGLFSAAPALSPTGTLTFTPAAGATGTATITVRLADDGGTANNGRNTSPEVSFTIRVLYAVFAPVVVR
jgi:hypothetical protein